MCVSFSAALLSGGMVRFWSRDGNSEEKDAFWGCTLDDVSPHSLTQHSLFPHVPFSFGRKIYNPFDRKAECCWIDPFIRLQVRLLPNTPRPNDSWPGLQVGRELWTVAVCRESICIAEDLVFWLFIRPAVLLVKLTRGGVVRRQRGGEGGVLYPYIPSGLDMHKSQCISSKCSW